MKRRNASPIADLLPRRVRHFPIPLRAAKLFAVIALAATATFAAAETCTTQSALAPAERDGIASAARTLAADVQADNAAALRSASVAEVVKDFNSLQYLVGATAPKLTGGVSTVDQVYLLDASTLKPSADGAAPNAQFFCSLNRSTMEAEFDIPALPPGKYAFAIVNIAPAPGASTTAPWRLSFLMRQEPAGQPRAGWQLAGFYPRPLTAAGHDGLWYWTQARELAKAKQPWNSWLYYQAAEKLLQPADFVISTHLDKLRTEAAAAAPPELSDGVSVDAPLVVKAADGTESHFTSLGIDDSLAQSSLDIAVHLHVDPLPDQAAARKRNDAAAAALIAAYPELRKLFHGVWVYAETTGQPPFATEQPMSAIQ